MKNFYKILLFSIFLIIYNSPLHATDVSGTIDTYTNWLKADSPFNLVGDVYIKSTTLAIENDVEVNLNGYNIYVTYNYLGSGSYTNKPGILTAAHVTFNGAEGTGSQIIYEGHTYNANFYKASGRLDNCTFDNIFFVFLKYSNPVIINSQCASTINGAAFTFSYGSQPEIENNAILGYDYAFHIQANGLPVLTDNDISGCNHQEILISGDFAKRYYINQQYVNVNEDFVLHDLGYNYKLDDDVLIRGKSFIIESGCYIDLNGFKIKVLHLYESHEYSNGSLQAQNATFVGDDSLKSRIIYQGYFKDDQSYLSTGTLDHCTLQLLQVYIDNYSTPTITNCNFESNNTGIAITSGFGSQPLITNNNIKNYDYPIGILSFGKPDITNNIFTACVHNCIALSGEFKYEYNYLNNIHHWGDEYILKNLGYTYQLINDVYINGITFKVEPNCSIFTDGHPIHINHYKIDNSNYRPGSLQADFVTFKCEKNLTSTIDFKGYQYDINTFLANGSIQNCMFENIVFYFDNNSNPTINNSTIKSSAAAIAFTVTHGAKPSLTDNIIDGFEYPFHLSSNGDPVISGNTIQNCSYEGIALSGEFSYQYYDYDINEFFVLGDQYILKNYNYPYYLKDDLALKGLSFTVAEGNSIQLKNHKITVIYDFLGYTDALESYLYANNVHFSGDSISLAEIEFQGADYNSQNYYAHGIFDSCYFENIKFADMRFSTVNINNCILLSNDSGTGITTNFDTELTLTNSILYRFATAIFIPSGTAVISNNDFLFCTDYAIKTGPSNQIDAQNNFWGHVTGPGHPDNPAGQGLKISGPVNFGPFSAKAFNMEYADMVINEIMYNPPGKDVNEYIEILNNDSSTVKLDNWQITDGVDFTFPVNTDIAPGEYIVITKDSLAFLKQYDHIENIFQWKSGELGNISGKIWLTNPDNIPVDLVSYSSEETWPAQANGAGPSLELVNPAVDNNLPENWSSSDSVYYPSGSPGELNSVSQNGNHRPVIFSTPDSSAYVNIEYAYQILAGDIDGDPLAYSPRTCPPFLTLDQNTGMITGTPLIQDMGTHKIEIDVEDNNGGKTSHSFTLTVFKSTPGIVINEIKLWNGNGQAPSFFIELFNKDTTAIDIAGWVFNHLDEYKFPDNNLVQPREYMVVEVDTTFLAKNSIGHKTDKRISNHSFNEHISLYNENNVLIDSVNYEQIFRYLRPDLENMSSIELVNPNLDNSIIYAWLTSSVNEGTPGQANSIYTETINYPPSRMRLISPDQDTVNHNIEFKWSRSVDLDNDSLSYNLVLFGNSSDTLITGLYDTSFVYSNNFNILKENTQAKWAVSVMDNIFTIKSIDTLKFYIPFQTSVSYKDKPVNIFRLYQNYPNPFNPSTKIKYSLKENSHVILEIYNIYGQQIKILIDKNQKAGNHETTWDGTSSFGNKISSGVYFYRLITEKYVQTKKMILLY